VLEKGQEYLRDTDPEIFSAITDELERQRNGINSSLRKISSPELSSPPWDR